MRPQKTRLSPREALNKAFLKQKSTRKEIDLFKDNFKRLLSDIDDNESEEFHKNLVTKFLRDTYYKDAFFINTKGRNDQVIHHAETHKSDVAVIIEAKRPKKTGEMLRLDDLNKKALHELILYFLREKITQKNEQLTHIIATNVHEWFIFDAKTFDAVFAQNKKLVVAFKESEEKKTTPFFYEYIAKPFVEKLQKEDLPFTYFDIRDYEEGLRDAEEEKKLIALYKIFSPEHLLKRSFANDSNTLDVQFYSELLHILGLTEITRKGKKLIERLPKGKRHSGSLLENAIAKLATARKILDTESNASFEKAIELCITWINRVLFLKLLEAQLIAYHKTKEKIKGDDSYAFLNIHKIKDFTDLNRLFFDVLAQKRADRHENVIKEFRKIPYLNSSLFEQTRLEKRSIFISDLDSYAKMLVHEKTAVKDHNHEKQTGELNTLTYLFAFLEAYDFSSESTEDIQEENKRLINAAVLGLIFEKINGYKDGSFFTPSFVTMYMCRKSLRKAAVQRFNEVKNWNCETLEDVYENVGAGRVARTEANEIVNSLKVCDPAVGSGHFLVSALNEIIAIKSDLRILQDLEGRRLKEYEVRIENDDLLVIDDDGDFFQYRPKSKESQRVQMALFHEKQKIIERCLFGVDLNPNSVKICRLRLWIELLKNAYYKNDNDLETLPNIDINIKCGDSLISRFALDADLSKTLKSKKISIENYQQAVMFYHKSTNSKAKEKLLQLMDKIKASFSTGIQRNSKEIKERNKLERVYHKKFLNGLFDAAQFSKTQQKTWEKEKLALEQKIAAQEKKIADIKTNKIYDHAFEWRFEFPEVLDANGDFLGFDVILGNPPYIQIQDFRDNPIQHYWAAQDFKTFEKTGDIYCLFYEKAMKLLKPKGTLNFITSNKWMRAGYGKKLRQFLSEKKPLQLIDLGPNVFKKATVDTNILFIENSSTQQHDLQAIDLKDDQELSKLTKADFISITNLSEDIWSIISKEEQAIKAKIEKIGTPLEDWDIHIYRGIITGLSDIFTFQKTKDTLNIKDTLMAANIKNAAVIKPFLKGRDIQKYKAEFADRWLLNTHNGVKNKDKTSKKKWIIPPIDVINDYPTVYEYLLKYKNEAEKRQDKGNHWTNLRNCAYLQEFEKEKIVYSDISQKLTFTLCKAGTYIDNTAYFIANNPFNKYFLAILNGKIIDWYYRKISAQLGKKAVRLFSIYVKQIPIPKISTAAQQPYVEKVEKIITQKAAGKNTNKLESELDQMIYKLYNLSEEEIKLIENS